MVSGQADAEKKGQKDWQIDEDAAAASASGSELPPKQHDGGGVIDEFSSRFRYEKTCSKFIMPNTEC